MLKVFDKTLKDIETEKEYNQYCEANSKEKIKDFCPCYVFAKDGTRVDILDLPEEQIIRIYRQALKEYVIARSNNELDRNGRIESVNDAFKIAEILKGKKTASFEGLKEIIKLFSPDFLNKYDLPMMAFSLSQNDINCYKVLAKQLLTPFVKDKMQKVDLIAKYIEESKDNFEDVPEEVRMKVIDQLIVNEQSKKSYLEINKKEQSYL